MRYAILIAVLLVGCAPQEHDLTPREAGPQAGSVALKSEPLLATNSCGETLDQMRQRHRNYITSKVGSGWTWASALSASTWYANGTGGRTMTATVNGGESLTYMRRVVTRSQSPQCAAMSYCQGGNKTNQWGCP